MAAIFGWRRRSQQLRRQSLLFTCIYIYSCKARRRLSNKGKIFSKYLNTAKSKRRVSINLLPLVRWGCDFACTFLISFDLRSACYEFKLAELQFTSSLATLLFTPKLFVLFQPFGIAIVFPFLCNLVIFLIAFCYVNKYACSLSLNFSHTETVLLGKRFGYYLIAMFFHWNQDGWLS